LAASETTAVPVIVEVLLPLTPISKKRQSGSI
jgi:hypothetical protein